MLKLCNIAPLASIMVVVTVFVCYLLFGTVQLTYIDQAAKPKLVIDQDGGADDAMAIFMAILYEKYYNGPQLVALTTTHGNVGEEQTYNNTQRILNVAERRNIPIFRGSAEALISGIPTDFYFGVDGLGDNYDPKTFKAIPARKEHAVFALINLSKKYKDKLVVVALGSLTNIALAIQIDPDFVSRLSQLYVAAGNIYSEEYSEPEFNAAMDPEAYEIVVKSGTPDKLTIVPFSQILMYQKISKGWRKNELGTINTKIIQEQNSFERISFDSTSFWSLLDPSAMAIVLEEKTVVEETVYSNNSIILCGKQRGINTNDFADKDEANSRIIYRVKKEPYKEFLYKLFSSDTRKTSVN